MELMEMSGGMAARGTQGGRRDVSSGSMGGTGRGKEGEEGCGTAEMQVMGESEMVTLLVR